MLKKRFFLIIKLATFILSIFVFSDSAFAQQHAYEQYIWNFDEPVAYEQVPQDLKTKLNSEIEKILDKGHLAPMYMTMGAAEYWAPSWYWGKSGSGSWSRANTYFWWFSPFELAGTLSSVLPYLAGDLNDSASLKGRLRNYLVSEMQDHPPATTGYFSINQGERREHFFLPDSYLVTIGWPRPRPPIETCYALWQYAQNTGDWQYIDNNWSDIQAVYSDFSERVGQNSVISYGEIGGLIGYARLLKHRGESTTEIVGRIVSYLDQGRDFHNFTDRLEADLQTKRYHQAHELAAFYNLTPELGKFLKDNASSSVQSYIGNKIKMTQVPNWYQARVEYQHISQTSTEENEIVNPGFSWTIFLGKARVLGESQDQLKKYLDIPWATGDWYFLQKLAATIEASGGGSPTCKKGDVNCDGVVNIQDFLMVLSNWGVGSDGDADGDGLVGIADLLVVLGEWGN